MTCGFLIQLVFCQKKKLCGFGVEVEQETSAPPSKKNPGSAPVLGNCGCAGRVFFADRGKTLILK